MVFTASLNVPVKKALKKIVTPSSASKICDNLILDPETTKMTCVILGPKDFVGPKGIQLSNALKKKHPNICVIYLYTNAAEADLCPNAYTEQARKINDKVVREAYAKFVGEHADDTGQRTMSSADFDAPEPDETLTSKPPIMEPGDDEFDWSTEPPASENKGPVVTAPQPEPEPQPVPEQPVAPAMDIPTTQPEVLPTTPISSEIPSAPATTTPLRPGGLEDRIRNVSSIKEWSLFQETLKHDSMVQDLVLSNSEYEGLVQMLDVMDTRIQAVWRDQTLTADQRFTKIKKIGLQKSSLRAGVNSINVDKAISIITTIVLAAQRTVDDKLQSIDSAVYKVVGDMAQIADTTHIDKAIQQRTKVQFELLDSVAAILQIYKSITNFLTEEIAQLDKNLPSSNEYINERTKPLGMGIFTPMNTQELTRKIGMALQENRLVWSQLEDRVNACIESLHELCMADEKIINYQREVIDMMRAQKVESTVIGDTLLKRILRLYVGADNTGRSATAIIWSGVLSRRSNTLLIDLTGRSKFTDYGITPVLLSQFMCDRIERPFLCVETRGKLDAEEAAELVTQLRTRLNYYQYVNVIVAPEDIDLLKQLSEEAYVVHYITDCSTASISQLRDIVEKNDVKNIAKKLVMIDSPISPLSIADSIGLDLTATKLIPLPAMSEVRACALKHDRPYDYPEITRIYEEAFR